MTSTQVYPQDSGFTFGFYWWIDNIRDSRFTWGHGGQYAIIVPGKKLLIVFTSIPNTQGNYQVHINEVLPFVDRIIGISY